VAEPGWLDSDGAMENQGKRKKIWGEMAIFA
jgi:hypothetical protein